MYGCMQSAAASGNRVLREMLAARRKWQVYGGREEKSRSGEDREESTEVDSSYQDWQQTTPENRWQVYPESEEAYRQELRREEEAQIERAREAGTTLLSAPKEWGRNGALRAGGSRRNSDSDFLYSIYTWKTSGAVGRMY